MPPGPARLVITVPGTAEGMTGVRGRVGPPRKRAAFRRCGPVSGLDHVGRGPAGGGAGGVSPAQLQQNLRVAGQVQAVLDQGPDRGGL